jgi:hypothetical protein
LRFLENGFELFLAGFRKHSHFYGLFELLMQRNGQKHDKTNQGVGTTGFVFGQNVFDFPQKVL